ncbi:MAG: Anhydro-N-acetylmuramic acid kinase [Chlorobi bacterium OLB7]|nr:MAG: Anhydro-N-acetylmuramic acid kinase [Chlorobi bacterium OLB7]
MSGTSLDGVDVAFVQIEGCGQALQFQLLGFATLPYSPALRSQLLRASDGQLPLREAYELDSDLGLVYADAIAEAARQWGIAPGAIAAVGLHGQTVYHNPNRLPAGVTVQIGSAAAVAQRLQTLVVSDFRTNDVAVGGQGAPLVPYCDLLLLRSPLRNRVALNIGGIANLTALPTSATAETLIAFDTGPGNMMIDAAMRHLFGSDYDAAGNVAATGTVNAPLLWQLLANPYFQAPPPKSAGREDFGEEVGRAVAQQALADGISPESIIATLTQLTATTIAEAIGSHCGFASSVDELIIGGGGVHNRTLMRMLGEAMPTVRILPSDECGLPSDAKEAICFAVLANEALCEVPANVPSVTGAARRVVCGAIRIGG